MKILTSRGSLFYTANVLNLIILTSSKSTTNAIRFSFTRRSFLASTVTVAAAPSSSITTSSLAASTSANNNNKNNMVDTTSKYYSTKTDKKASKIWDSYAESYSKSPIGDEEAYQTKLETTQTYFQELLSGPNSKTNTLTVLEIGCGTGGTALKHSPFIGGTTGSKYVATDISPKMIEIAKSRAKESSVTTKDNIEYRVESIDTLNDALPKQSQDVVLGLSLLHLLPNRRDDMKKIASWIKPGGYFVTSTICAADMGWMVSSLFKTVLPVGHYFGFVPKVCALSKSDLKQDFIESGFKIVHEWQPKPDAAVFIIGQKTE